MSATIARLSVQPRLRIQPRRWVQVILLGVLLAACGGGGGGGSSPGDQTPRTRFSAQVTFGDSLSDVGSYAVGAIAAAGGGKYTINGDNRGVNPALTGKTWTELTAAQFGLPAPCAAQTGLQGDPARGLSVPVVNHAGCYGYAQGGARVSDPVGIGNIAGSPPLGLLTVPVVTQVANHLAAVGSRFQGTEIVFVMAGGNDLILQVQRLAAGAEAAAQAAGPSGADRARADYLFNTGPQAITQIATVASDLATLVRERIVGAGARYVVVNNVPDLARSPFGNAQAAGVQALIQAMVEAFNRALKVGLEGQSGVVLVDLYALTRDQIANPAPYGLTDVRTPACAQNQLGGSALVCNASNTQAGADVSHYLFADSVHPTPFEHSLVAREVMRQMMVKGWL